MHNAALEINLSALRANYRLLKNRHAKQNCAAVVKADAYGLGVAEVSKALWAEGCREFFVAQIEEAVELRGILLNADIGVFNGMDKGEEKEYENYRLMPVVNTLEQAKWQAASGKWQAILHVDTGMTRLGLSESDLEKMSSHLPLATSHLPLLMSHLACADDPKHPKNAEQLMRFKAALKYFPKAKASLANSAGLFLPKSFHFDVARPGCALYGINPTQDKNPMRHVATLSAPILQIRTLGRNETVGYDATYKAKKGARIALAALGYADGYLRTLSNTGVAYLAGRKAPVIGRVSMDMIAIDVSAIPPSRLAARAELINEHYTVNDAARAAGTIGYEIFTRIGNRVKRVYS